MSKLTAKDSEPTSLSLIASWGTYESEDSQACSPETTSPLNERGTAIIGASEIAERIVIGHIQTRSNFQSWNYRANSLRLASVRTFPASSWSFSHRRRVKCQWWSLYFVIAIIASSSIWTRENWWNTYIDRSYNQRCWRDTTTATYCPSSCHNPIVRSSHSARRRRADCWIRAGTHCPKCGPKYRQPLHEAHYDGRAEEVRRQSDESADPYALEHEEDLHRLRYVQSDADLEPVDTATLEGRPHWYPKLCQWL